MNNNPDIVRLLLDRNANFYIQNRNRRNSILISLETALQYAKHLKRNEIAQIIRNHIRNYMATKIQKAFVGAKLRRIARKALNSNRITLNSDKESS